MDPKLDTKQCFEHMQREHEELRELLGKVSRTLAKRLETVAHVSEMLGSLCDHVEDHFTEEEVGGFFDQIATDAPRFYDMTQALCDEHSNLLARVKQLAEQATKGDGSHDWWHEMEKQFHKFSICLMHHESQENELLQQAYTEDIGAQD